MRLARLAGGRWLHLVSDPVALVVARGHARLLAEFEAMFRDDPRVRVIENRRQGHALLPRGETVTPAK
ncbi:MAG: hypothetical protein L0027_05190, partial [Candidatus Rokubacteria bacterium]|nr:hypothetical protein [Candidatus Rokubacteria bacterium]